MTAYLRKYVVKYSSKHKGRHLLAYDDKDAVEQTKLAFRYYDDKSGRWIPGTVHSVTLWNEKKHGKWEGHQL